MNRLQSMAIIRTVGGLVFDATFEETHQSELQITDNPVETGVVVSDHAYMMPLKLSIKAGVSDTLLRSLTPDQFASSYSRSRRAFELLQLLQASAEPFDVQTGLRLYHNMVCTSVHATQDKDSARVLLFDADVREVIIASTQIVTYPPRKAGSTARQGAKKAEKGEQQGKQITDDKKKGSLLSKLVAVIGGVSK